MAKPAQTWLNDYLTHFSLQADTLTEIKGKKIPVTTSLTPPTPGISHEELTGELIIKDYPQLKILDLTNVAELDKLTITNCPSLEEVILRNSGIKELVFTSQLDKLNLLDFSFEVNASRTEERKLDQLDLNNVTNLKKLRCIGVHKTKLVGIENLKKLQEFRSNNIFPIDLLHKWKKYFDTITATDPNHLDLLKGGSGTDKDDIDPSKLKKYKESFGEYARIQGKLGGKISDDDLDNFLRAELEKSRLERDLTEVESKLVKAQKDKDNARYLNIALGLISVGLFYFLVWLFREKNLPEEENKEKEIKVK